MRDRGQLATMRVSDESIQDQTVRPLHNPAEGERKQQILHELDNILESRFFRSAGRSKQFLKFVVEHKLEGHLESLKERTIGVEVFQRPPNYATGDDPVVRVQAGEVRRRLDQYYQEATNKSTVRIELPLGSYSPIFQEHSTATPTIIDPIYVPLQEPKPRGAKKRTMILSIVAACSAALLMASVAFLMLHRAIRHESALEQFWNPVFASQQPVIICLAAPVVYRPYDVLYQRYARTHPGTFQTEMEKVNIPLPLDPKEPILWGEMYNYTDYGVARGDTYAAVQLSALFGKIGKPSQVRIGANYSFEDLRNSPAVVVGAFNNRWTMQITSSLHFAFEQTDQTRIRELIKGGRVWEKHVNSKGEVLDDTAIVGRLLDSKTGQFTIVVAGIGGTGTQAAAEFVSNPELLADGLRDAPAGWQTKNLEVVLQTTVTDSVPGPPRVVASYSW
jgi:hypothetical protein